ncbi:MAG: phosphoribosylaminoimidazolesuccinocarboxamide synthase [Candidatus Buchananbacteria bacterium]|nr:phosphoribosylaminoimidazolesuccinocarboxamide synthase [Candidatus Buchananbacteria bacterium]
MAKLPPNVQYIGPESLGLPLATGKVRNTYAVPGHDDLLLPLATDRLSIFDFVLNALVKNKGEILNAMSVFWRLRLLADRCPHDLVACGAAIDDFLLPSLRGNIELQKRAVVVRKLKMVPREMIVRGYLTGSGWPKYQETGEVCGHKLPPGLHDGSKLPYPIFTPTSKATVGHDVHVDANSVVAEFGFGYERTVLQLYGLARDFCAERGILLVDTKFEMGEGVVFGDELLTPDSSRFWSRDAWLAAQAKGKVPPAFDKEFVRTWGKGLGIDKRNPENPDDVDWVHAQVVPPEILATTTQIYRYIFWRLTDKKLEVFQADEMGIDVDQPEINVDVVVGSESDLPQVTSAVEEVRELSGAGQVRLHVCSCHRNPDMLRMYIEQLKDVDVIVAGAGKAAALPGVVKSWLGHFGKDHIPVIGVALEGSDYADNDAAELSIAQLPGQPVELDAEGRVYFGAQGMRRALKAAVEDEFLPRKISPKEAKFNIGA